MFVVNVDWFFLSHRLPIALAAQKQGYRVHIATGLTDKLDELQGHGFVVHPLALDRSGTGLIGILRTLAGFWVLFRVVRPDIVHLVTIKPVLLGGIAARLARVPAVVAAVSGLGFVFISHGAKAMFRRWLVGIVYSVALGQRNLKVIFQNIDDKIAIGKLACLQDSKVEIIRGSGVDLAKFIHKPMPLGVPVVILAARMLIDKGVYEFVQAARLVKQHGVLARFCLIGTVDPANPASLNDAELAQLANEGIVELWGHRADMLEVLLAAHVVALPSYREGLPKVLMEAAACGRVVVTTDVPGCRDAIIPDVSGILVPARDAVALAAVIMGLIDSPARCQAMGDAGRALAESAFDVRQVVAKHLCIYQDLIERL